MVEDTRNGGEDRDEGGRGEGSDDAGDAMVVVCGEVHALLVRLGGDALYWVSAVCRF